MQKAAINFVMGRNQDTIFFFPIISTKKVGVTVITYRGLNIIANGDRLRH